MKRYEWNMIKERFTNTIAPLKAKNEALETELEEVKAERDKLLTSWNDADALRYRLDELGKIQQTTTGTGDAFDPIKFWTDGMAVEAGKWYQCYDEHGYIWEAKKDGVPAHSKDEEYFDVVE